jgi:hypothetical protein
MAIELTNLVRLGISLKSKYIDIIPNKRGAGFAGRNHSTGRSPGNVKKKSS